LALSLVGSYLGNDRGLTLADVTQQLQAKGLETGWLNQADPSVAERGLKAAIDLSWEILESRVQDFACFLSWFAYAPIPWYLVESAIAILNEPTSEPQPESSVFKKVWNFLNQPLFSQSSHSLTTPIPQKQTNPLNTEKLNFINSDLQNIRQILVRFHFLEIEDLTIPSYKIHPLLQQYLRDKATQQIDPDYRKILVQAIVQEAKKIEYPSTVQQLEALRPALPHITEVAEVWIGDIIDENDIITPSACLAWFYENLVDYLQAEFWFQKARTNAQERLPAKYPVIATTLNNLAVFYTSQGKYDEAETIFLEVLKIKRETLPFNHYLLTPHINNLANLYRLKAKYKKAEILQLECLKIERESLPINYSQLSSCLNNLALLYKFQGKYDEAESLYLESLKIKQEKFPAEYLEFIVILNNLATLYQKKGNYVEAESSLSKVLSIARCNLLPNNPQLAIYINNLAELYRSQKKYKEAEILRLECLKIECESLPSNHPQLECSRNNLTALYQLQGKYNDAEDILQEVLFSARKNSSLNYPNLAIPLNSLAELYRSQGKYNEAEPLYLEALTILEQSLEIDHPNTVTVRENYQLLLQQKEEHQT
jgi:tetratricopeptide (TPR) repeat protein